MAKALKHMTEVQRKAAIARRLAEKRGGLGHLSARDAEAAAKRKNKQQQN